MNNMIAILGIIAAFVFGTLMANPVGEAVSGWKLAVQDLQNQIDALPDIQVYEVSTISLIEKGSNRGDQVQLRCLDGDWFLNSSPVFSFTTEPSITGEGIRLSASSDPIFEGDENSLGSVSKIIAFDVLPIYSDLGAGPVAPFDISITITSLCLSPSQ